MGLVSRGSGVQGFRGSGFWILGSGSFGRLRCEDEVGGCAAKSVAEAPLPGVFSGIGIHCIFLVGLRGSKWRSIFQSIQGVKLASRPSSTLTPLSPITL